jgi:hypothetical protein
LARSAIVARWQAKSGDAAPLYVPGQVTPREGLDGLTSTLIAISELNALSSVLFAEPEEVGPDELLRGPARR